MPFWTYILDCRYGVFYTGHTDDLDRRIADHKSGDLPGWTKDCIPAELVWSQEFSQRREAVAAEKQIKRWSSKQKLALIRGERDDFSLSAKSKNDPSTRSGRTILGREILGKLISQASSAFPVECCGLLLGDGQIIKTIKPAANVHPEPARHFEIDPAQLIAAHKAARSGGLQVIGYYHSHPKGPPEPSKTDSALAANDGKVWAIIGHDEVRFWRDQPSGFEPVSYSVLES